MIPDANLVTRFAADLDALAAPGRKIGIAVSGGPDSLALLLLAAAVRPGAVEVATVDHGLRAESADEALTVTRICAELGVPHSVLAVTVEPGASLQAQAREARYQALAHWAEERGLSAIATAHHLDDQAETLLMRIARGSGVGGLAGVQASRPLPNGVQLVRPLLGWRRSELESIVAGAGLTPIDDPSNADERYDRTRARALLASTQWLEPERMAQVAVNAANAEEALGWSAAQAFESRAEREGKGIKLDPNGLPRELKRRLLVGALAALGADEPAGPALMRALEALDAGETVTLAGLKLEGGTRWRLSPAPPRRERPFTP